MTGIKFCGLKTNEAILAAGNLHAAYIGLMLWPKSSRAVTNDQTITLASQVPSHVKVVGVFVNPSDDELKNILTRAAIDMIQLHGDEDPRRAAEIRSLFGLPIIKAISVATKDDLTAIATFESVADHLLFDTKAANGERGGTGQSFDWQILKDRSFHKPWMLSGGLDAENVGRALSILKPDSVDISSGIEDSQGVKSIEKMQKFAAAISATK